MLMKETTLINLNPSGLYIFSVKEVWSEISEQN